MDTMIVDGIEVRQTRNPHYWVSRKGDVWSTWKNMWMKHEIDRKGYHRIFVRENGGRHHVRVHTMVYDAWGKEPVPDGHMICHIDDNKDNNDISNLYVGTMSDNAKDTVRNRHHKQAMELKVYDKWLERERTFYPAREIAVENGELPSHERGMAIKEILKRPWFDERYIFISAKKVVA